MPELKTDKNISLNDVLVMNEMQAKTRYSIGRNRLLEAARDAGAIVKNGTKNGYLRPVLDEYFLRKAE